MYRLTTEQEAIVAKARAIATGIIAAEAAEVDAQGRFPAEGMRALAEAGLWGLLVPGELGGLGQGLRTLAAVVDEIAQRCASTAMIFMMHNCGVNCYLAEPVKFEAELRAAAAGQHLSTLAFSEKGSRSQFWAPVSRAVAGSSGSGVTLSAEKSWVTSAGIADGIVSSCGSASGTGPSVYLVKKDDPGLTISGGWNSLGMRGNQSNPMTLTDVALENATRLIGVDGKGDDIMLGKALPVFQICQGAIGVGIAEAAFAATQKHLTAHGFEHTGTKLMDLPNLRARLAATSTLAPGRYVAFAGIGRPSRFFDALGRQAGVELLEGAPYPDHHAFTQYDVSFLMKLAADHDARLVTTDKDHVRLPADMKDKVARASVKAAFEDEEALARLLDGVVR